MPAQGNIGSKDLAAGNQELICTMDEPGIVNISVCNRTAIPAKISIAIGNGANPTAKDYIQFSMPLSAFMPLERTGRSLGAGWKVWVMSDIAGCSACAEAVPST